MRLAHVDSDVEEDDGVDGVESEASTSESQHLRHEADMRASAPTLKKPLELSLPHSRYTPVYRKTTTVVQHHTRSSSSKNVTVTSTPTSVTTTTLTRVMSGRPVSSLSAKSLPRIRDLDEIRATVPLVDRNAL